VRVCMCISHLCLRRCLRCRLCPSRASLRRGGPAPSWAAEARAVARYRLVECGMLLAQPASDYRPPLHRAPSATPSGSRPRRRQGRQTSVRRICAPSRAGGKGGGKGGGSSAAVRSHTTGERHRLGRGEAPGQKAGAEGQMWRQRRRRAAGGGGSSGSGGGGRWKRQAMGASLRTFPSAPLRGRAPRRARRAKGG